MERLQFRLVGHGRHKENPDGLPELMNGMMMRLKNIHVYRQSTGPLVEAELAAFSPAKMKTYRNNASYSCSGRMHNVHFFRLEAHCEGLGLTAKAFMRKLVDFGRLLRNSHAAGHSDPHHAIFLWKVCPNMPA